MKNIHARFYFDVTIPLKDSEDYQDNDLLIDKALELVNDNLEDDIDIVVNEIEQLDLSDSEVLEAEEEALNYMLNQADDYNDDKKLGVI